MVVGTRPLVNCWRARQVCVLHRKRVCFSTSTPSRAHNPIRLNTFERVALTAGSAIAGFVDPARGDMVAMLGELTGEPALRRIRSKMLDDAEGSKVLHEKPRIRFDDTTIKSLSDLPPETFGAAYAAYLHTHGFSPMERAEVQYIEDPELAFVMQRYREVHDFWHVLSGLPPSVLGETAVKWLEMVQTGLPMTAMSALVAPLRLPAHERELMRRVYAPWATACGHRARYLMAVRYENHFEQPLEKVREQLHFTPAPSLKEAMAQIHPQR